MISFLQGDVFDKLEELDDNSIDCVVTSPPYWGLRDYGVPGQLGLEPTYQEHIQNIVKLFRVMKPKLKDSATVWLNYGDSYAATINGTKAKDVLNDDRAFRDKPFSTIQGSLKPKDLVMIPNRIAIALQDDGWWIRSEIIWHKPNPMPESVRDRPTSAHEKIWLITKSKKYYYDVDAIREPCTESTKQRYKSGWNGNEKRDFPGSQQNNFSKYIGSEKSKQDALKGKNKRNVWTVTTKPCKEAHFATFPKDLIEPCIKAGCPEGGLVLDPFGGSGTTGIVAKQFNRTAILIELNPEYIEIAKKRINKELGMFR
jgi:DNA modification methylase